MPSVVRIRVNSETGRAKVTVASTADTVESSYKYDFRLRKVGGRQRQGRNDSKAQISTTAQTTFSGLTVGARYAVKYRLVGSLVTTEFSREKVFTVREKP
jgi:hypothetical protein